jgi:hypothetical protein
MSKWIYSLEVASANGRISAKKEKGDAACDVLQNVRIS